MQFIRRREEVQTHIQTYHKLLALDAMGVIYAEANDGLNLLYPFIIEKGGCKDVQEIIRLYSAASLGKISSADFWTQAGINPSFEDEYLAKHRLSEGLIDFLEETRSGKMEFWCLSNDVSEWSAKLRKRFGLDRYFRGFVISGDTGACKPDPAIYRYMLDKSGFGPSDVIFVDDRLRNIETAHSLGMETILFNPLPQESQGHSYAIVRDFSQLLSVLNSRLKVK